MNRLQILKLLVNERVNVAVEEIFRIIEKIITEYEDEAFISKQENVRQQKLLETVLKKRSNYKLNQADLLILPPSEDGPHPEPGQEWIPTSRGETHLKTPQSEDKPEELFQREDQSKEPFERPERLDASTSTQLPVTVSDQDVDKTQAEPQANTSAPKQVKTEDDSEEDCEITEIINFDSEKDFPQPAADGQPLPSDISERESEDGDHYFMETSEPGLSGSQNRSAEEIHQMLQSATEMASPPLSCKVCNLTFTATNSLRRHVQTHPNDCGLCGKHLEPTETLKIHYIGHKTCIVCGKVCSSISALEMHVRSHVGDKPFRCAICGRRFVQKGNLKSHMSIHMNDKQFHCPICGRSFRWKVSVQKHLKTHPEALMRSYATAV